LDYDARYATFLRNTLTLAAVTSMVAVAAAVVVAYGARVSRSYVVLFFGRIASMGYALPGSVIAVGVLVPLAFIDHTLDAFFRTTLGHSTGLLLTGSMIGLIFAYVVRFLAVSHQTVEASLVKVTPSMDMAARSLGAKPGRLLRCIHVPLIRTGLTSAALLVFVDVMKEMPATLLLRPFGYETLAIRVWQLTSESLWELAALPALSIVGAGIIPVLVLTRSSIRSPRRRGPTA
jgi:iron(III) transport system permease protein